MSIVTAFILLGLLILTGFLIAKFLPRERILTSKDINGLEDLLERKKDSNLKLPIFFFSLLVSILFMSWIFDANYDKMVENKLFTSPAEKLDSVFEMAIVLPAPPKVKPPEVKPEIQPDPPKDPEIKEVEKEDEKPKEKIKLNELLPDDLPFDGDGEDPDAKQQADNTTYMPGQVDVIPSCDGLKDYLALSFKGVRAPTKYKIQKKKYSFVVTFVVEKDGSVSNIKLGRRYKDELSEDQQKKIIDIFSKLPQFSPGRRVDQPVKVRTSQRITLNP